MTASSTFSSKVDYQNKVLPKIQIKVATLLKNSYTTYICNPLRLWSNLPNAGCMPVVRSERPRVTLLGKVGRCFPLVVIPMNHNLTGSDWPVPLAVSCTRGRAPATPSRSIQTNSGAAPQSCRLREPRTSLPRTAKPRAWTQRDAQRAPAGGWGYKPLMMRRAPTHVISWPPASCCRAGDHTSRDHN